MKAIGIVTVIIGGVSATDHHFVRESRDRETNRQADRDRDKENNIGLTTLHKGRAQQSNQTAFECWSRGPRLTRLPYRRELRHQPSCFHDDCGGGGDDDHHRPNHHGGDGDPPQREIRPCFFPAQEVQLED